MRPRDILADNLKALMAERPDLDTFPQITKAGGGSNGTLDRIRRKVTATSVDNLQPLALTFGLQAWHLLYPDLMKNGGLPDWPFDIDQSRYLALTEKQKGYVEAKLEEAIAKMEDTASSPPPAPLDALRQARDSAIVAAKSTTGAKKTG